MSRAKRLNKQQRGASRSVSQTRRPTITSSSFVQSMVGWIKVFAGVCMLATIAIGGVWLAPKLSPNIEHVVVEGDSLWLEESRLREVIYQNLDQGILQLEIALLRDEIEQVPWVEQAEVVREFPATLVVRILEQQAIAQWNDQGYISQNGDFIASAIFEELDHLPKLSSDTVAGIPGEGASQAIELFHLLSSAVLVSGESIRTLRSNRAGGWSMQWDSGLLINLGRKDHLNRSRHALAAWQRLPQQQKQKIVEMDARYNNGVAVLSKPLTAIRSELLDSDGIEVVTKQVLSANPAKSKI